MKYCLILLLTVLTVTGCNKDRDTEAIKLQCLDGTIKYMGEPAADGLGWVLLAGAESPRYYVLSDLPRDYQKEGLAVNACIYSSGKKVNCMCAAPPEEYKVKSVRKR